MKKSIITVFFVGVLFLTACQSHYVLTDIEGESVKITSQLDATPHPITGNIIANYKQKVDSIMLTVIGKADRPLTKKHPESPLSNFIADILRQSAVPYIGKAADVALMNMGGIRNDLPSGNITFGHIFEIAPFENTLCLVKMTGAELHELFKNIAAVHGEGISGAQLIISKDGKLISAKVNGKALSPQKEYYLATIDYVAEGNDKMYALKDITDKRFPPNATLRDLILRHIEQLTQEGKTISAKTENRIVIQ